VQEKGCCDEGELPEQEKRGVMLWENNLTGSTFWGQIVSERQYLKHIGWWLLRKVLLGEPLASPAVRKICVGAVTAFV